MSDTAEKNESGKEVTGNAGIGVGCNLKLGGRGVSKVLSEKVVFQ